MIRKEDGIGSRAPSVWTRLGQTAFGLALIAACSRGSKPTAPGCCEKSGPGWTDDAGQDSAAPASSASAKPPARFRIEEGCARDFKSAQDPSRDLGELERLCAQGLAPILAPADTTRPTGSDVIEVPFRVGGSTACLRAGAVGVAAGQAISLETAQGKVLAAATSTDTIAVVPVDGTVCVREAGVYRLVVKPSAGSEARTLTVQVWQASRD
ncbi:MAG TPA: hypothetical protein VK540_08935 [Polyangiaceae bacterium]|jgi:hypothetical protein|nr:hypothetical protein [Polyangiaceae bacterium]